MVEKEPKSPPAEDYSDFDQAIEEDIRRLKRSSNILILLGMLVVLLLFVVIGFRGYLYLLNSRIAERTRIKDYIFVKNDNTVVYAQPDKTSNIIAKLTKGEALFLIDDQNGWARIEKRTISGWVERANLAAKEEWPPPQQQGDVPIRFIDVNWIVDELDNFTIIGKIENLSEVPLKNIKIQVNFHSREDLCCDENGNPHPPVITRETWVAREKPLVAGVEQKFIITGKYEKNFKKIRYRIVSYE